MGTNAKIRAKTIKSAFEQMALVSLKKIVTSNVRKFSQKL